MNRCMKRRMNWLLLLSALLFCGQRAAADEPLTDGWEFLRGDLGHVWEAFRPALPGKPESVPLWTPVSLPHCFNAEDAVDPDVNYYQGAGWYRTTLDVANPYAGGRTLLRFAGAGQKTEVYVYTTLVATHTGGYDAWQADITEAVDAFRRNPVCRERFGGRIPVAVRCDNGRDREMIPSDMSDFNLYGGLYRPVALVYLPAVHLADLRIEASVDEKGETGTVEATVSVAGGSGSPVVRIADASGRVIASQTCSDGSVRFVLPRPALWSPDRPVCYTCTAALSTNGGTHRIERRFGFRRFRFEAHGPFYLNGKRLLLRGTHRHEDHAGVGAAMTDGQIVAEMQQIKAMGANFIRLGHYQQSDAVLDACDTMGLLVWEEIPWCRGGLGGEAYRAQARRMLSSMIAQHRHHPSVILWGLGNENDWPGDFEEFDRDRIRAFMAELHELSHRLDPTRLTCIRRCDFCKDVVDVYSPSIWAGWYSRRYTDYVRMTREGFERVPRFLHAEWGADSHAGRHAESAAALDIEAGDRNGDWSETYAVRLFDWHLKEQERMPWLTGAAFWTFKDFSTPLRPDNPIPYVNQKGVVQRDGTPKESYYVFQSYWSDRPMVRIYGHSQPVRWGAAGESKEVLVYSNCDEAELFVNGHSAGVRRRDSQDFPAAGLHWQVVLPEGENRIEAVARSGKTVVRDAIVQQYTARVGGEPAQLQLRIVSEGGERFAEALLCDRDGNRCFEAADFIRFGATDLRALSHNQGTATGSLRIQAANGRAVIRLHDGIGAVVSARCEGRDLKPAFIQTY